MSRHASRGFRLIAIVMLLLLTVLYAACGEDSAPTPGEPAGATTEVTVRTEGLRFAPADLRLPAGAPIKLTLVNADPVVHDVTVDELDVRVIEAGDTSGSHDGMMDGSMGDGMMGGSTAGLLHVAADASGTASGVFVINEQGTFTFYCTVPGHREAGMTGTLTVY